MIKIYPSTISGQLHAPSSKAHAQRLLFMASMTARPTRIKNVPICTDIDDTIKCLEDLGCTVTREAQGSELFIKPFTKTSPMPEVELNFKDSATIATMATVLCSSLGIKAKCKASEKLQKRRMLELTSRMVLRGATFTSFSLPYEISGRLGPGEFILPGDEGSQAISAIMMFASCLLSDSTITYSSPLGDDGDIKLTAQAMQQFGIKIEEIENGYHIIGRQYYQSPKEIEAENDWSLASMWTIAGAACNKKGGEVTVDGLKLDSPQGYKDQKKILSLICYDFFDVNFDITNSPDLVTLLCALAIVKGASIQIKTTGSERHKETDRLKLMANIAEEFGQKAVVGADYINIIGNRMPKFPQKPIDTEGDPWVFMAMVLASTKADQEIILDDEHGAEKIYANFLSDFKSLGGKYEII